MKEAYVNSWRGDGVAQVLCGGEGEAIQMMKVWCGFVLFVYFFSLFLFSYLFLCMCVSLSVDISADMLVVFLLVFLPLVSLVRPPEHDYQHLP